MEQSWLNVYDNIIYYSEFTKKGMFSNKENINFRLNKYIYFRFQTTS